jgi:superfamily I DNA/RNA helicase
MSDRQIHFGSLNFSGQTRESEEGGVMESGEDLQAHYDSFDVAAKNAVKKIVQSDRPKRIVAAGPGTGKTHLFKAILEGKKNALVLTFINALVEDLHLQLPGFATVKTLHGYARSILSKAEKETIVFDELTNVVESDAKILGVDASDIAAKVRENVDACDIEFYLKRRSYYGNYFSHDDLIYEAVRLLTAKPEKIEAYDQILIDEFQDFNNVDVALIDLLATQSPVIIAGDDDQALYGFRNSTYEHLREKFIRGDEFESFSLPYCFRCPRVVVQAVNDVIEYGKSQGVLNDRIDKTYEYFESAEKDAISQRFPSVVHVELRENAICAFIVAELTKIVGLENDKFDVLVVTPYSASGFQTRLINQLDSKGFGNIDTRRSTKTSKLIQGLGLITETGQQYSNLGWRVIAQEILAPEDFKSALESSNGSSVPFYRLIDTEIRNQIKGISSLVRKLRDKQKLTSGESLTIKDFLNIDGDAVINGHIAASFSNLDYASVPVSIRNTPIKVTNILKSKGLSADYVFITHLDDRFFLEKEDTVTEKDIFNLVVALSRAKKRVYLISMPDNHSKLVKVLENGQAVVTGRS